MDIIKYNIMWISNDLCRIESNDCRTIYKTKTLGLSGGLCSMDILLATMEEIRRIVKEKYGNDVVFTIHDWRSEK